MSVFDQIRARLGRAEESREAHSDPATEKAAAKSDDKQPKAQDAFDARLEAMGKASPTHAPQSSLFRTPPARREA